MKGDECFRILYDMMRKPKPKIPVGRVNPLTPERFIKALPGTFGIMLRIAENLGCTYQSIYNIMNARKPYIGRAWDRARRLRDIETEQLGDEAEKAVRDSIQQRMDYATSARTALKTLTSKFRNRGWIDTAKMIHEGGDKPIQIEHHNIPFDQLNLKLETRKEILDAIEELKAKQGREQLAIDTTATVLKEGEEDDDRE